MKAIAVIPGRADSIHLREAPKPSVDDVPAGRGVLVRVLRVGVDGTDAGSGVIKATARLRRLCEIETSRTR